jgi:hypothetical protein
VAKLNPTFVYLDYIPNRNMPSPLFSIHHSILQLKKRARLLALFPILLLARSALLIAKGKTAANNLVLALFYLFLLSLPGSLVGTSLSRDPATAACKEETPEAHHSQRPIPDSSETERCRAGSGVSCVAEKGTSSVVCEAYCKRGNRVWGFWIAGFGRDACIGC